MARAFSAHWASSCNGMDPSIDVAELRLRRSVTFDRLLIVITMQLANLDNIRERIEAAIEKVHGQGAHSKQRHLKVVFADGARPSFSKGSLLLAVSEGPFSTILEILQSKKDPLIMSRASLLEPQRRLAVRSGEPVVISDDPQDPLNSPANFGRTTRLILSSGPVPDASRLLAFEASFRDDARLAELADELLKPMQSENAQ